MNEEGEKMNEEGEKMNEEGEKMNEEGEYKVRIWRTDDDYYNERMDVERFASMYEAVERYMKLVFEEHVCCAAVGRTGNNGAWREYDRDGMPRPFHGRQWRHRISVDDYLPTGLAADADGDFVDFRVVRYRPYDFMMPVGRCGAVLRPEDARRLAALLLEAADDAERGDEAEER